MAFVIYIYEPASVFILHVALLYWVLRITNSENRNNEALMAAAYISGAEVFFRMTDGLIFYETGKYMVIVFLTIGLFYKGSSVKTIPFWFYLLILAPGIVVASVTLDYHIEFREAIAFNLSGPVSLGVTAVYCYYKKISKLQMEKVLMMMLMPLIANMAYLYFYTPELGTNININANYAASGGYGPNQIATVMGLGAFLLITRLYVIKSKTINFVDLALLGLMSYRALATFSRGGVITAGICAVCFILLFTYKQNSFGVARVRFKSGLLIAALFLTWIFVSAQTSGLIGNRYANETRSGESRGDYTTGRIELLQTELEVFYHHPLIGVGVGKSLEYRKEETGTITASHNEITRMLAEHGILGVIAILILIFVPFLFWIKFKNNYYFMAFIAFWFLTVNHSAMRIALPGFIYGLALLYIVNEKKNTLYR